MARKTTGTTTTKRRKKAEVPAATVPLAPKVREEIPTKGTQPNDVPVNFASQTFVASRNIPVSENIPASESIEEQIRQRAYELYLQRRANGSSENGNGGENQDWLTAEREIHSRQEGRKGRGVAAGGSHP